jgi:transposase
MTSTSKEQSSASDSKSLKSLCDVGQMKVKSSISEHQAASDSIMYSQCVPQSQPQQNLCNHDCNQSVYVTQESLLEDKKMTLKETSNSCEKNSQTMKLFKISQAGSISIEGDLSTSWTKHSKDIYKKLWCPIETDSLELPSHCLNMYSTSSESGSWFSKKIYQYQNPTSSLTSSPSYIPFLHECMEKGLISENINEQKIFQSRRKSTNEETQTRVLRMGIKMSKNQRTILRRWFGSVRYTYNTCVAFINSQTTESFGQYQELVKKMQEGDDKLKEIDLQISPLRQKLDRLDELIKECGKKKKRQAEKETLQSQRRTILVEKKSLQKLYNERVREVQKEIPKDKGVTNFDSATDLRNRFVLSTSDFYKERQWMHNHSTCAYKESREQAVFDFHDAFMVELTKVKLGQLPKVNMGFRKSTDFSESIVIPKSAFTTKASAKNPYDFGMNIFTADCGDDPKRKEQTYLKFRERTYKNGRKDQVTILKELLLKDKASLCNSRLVRKGNKYFLHLTYTLSKGQTIRQYPKTNNVCSLDPGLNHHQMVYDLNNQRLIEYSNQDNLKKLMGLLCRKEHMLKRRNKKRSWFIKRLEYRIQNLRDELHYKLINDLVNTCDLVICPKFEVQGMNKKGTGKKKNRAFRLLSHYKFRTRLQQKFEDANKMFVLGKEPYTSRTCGVCLTVNEKIGKREETAKCNQCGSVYLRDGNGARNNGLVFFHLLEQLKDLTKSSSGDEELPHYGCDDEHSIKKDEKLS